MLIAKENRLHSIGFPLISAGIFDYPLDGAWRKAIQACNDFICNNLDDDLKAIFAVLDDKILTSGEKIIKDIVLDVKAKDSVIKWCEKYTVHFHSINEDDELRCCF